MNTTEPKPLFEGFELNPNRCSKAPMPTIGSPVTSGNFPIVRRYCFLKQTWAGPWLYQPWLSPTHSSVSVAPQVSKADVIYDFGTIWRQGDNAATAWVPYPAAPYYLAIAIQKQGFAPQVTWVGQITEDEIVQEGPGTASGLQTYTAFGLEHILDRCYVDRSRVRQDGKWLYIDRVLSFNERTARGGQIIGNRSSLPDTDIDASGNTYPFVDAVGSGAPSTWDNKQICQYLLTNFVNHLPDGSVSPIRWELAGQTDALAQIQVVSDFGSNDARPSSVWACLNKLIDRRNGVGFTIRTTGAPGATVYIWVFTLVENPVVVGDSTLPANTEQVRFTMPTALPYSQLVDPIPIRYSATAMFDTVLVRSEVAQLTGTWSMVDSTLEKGWTDSFSVLPPGVTVSEETYYNYPNPGTDEDADLIRSQPRFEKVYSYFRVPRDWNWELASGNLVDPGHAENVAITANDDGTVSDTPPSVGTWYNYARVFERDLPFQQGFDYSYATPLNNNFPDAEPEFLAAFALLIDPDMDTAATGTEGYFMADQGSVLEDDMPNCTIRPADREFAMWVKASPAYLIAQGTFPDDFSGDPTSEPNDEPRCDFDSLMVTAQVKTDWRLHVKLSGISNPTLETKPRLTVDLPDCHFWYAANNTCVGLDTAGKLQYINASIGLSASNLSRIVILRDDSKRLRRVAAFMRWWFSRRRQAVAIKINLPGTFVQPGALLTDISTIWTREPVNAIVSSVAIDYVGGSTTVTTAYLELDGLVALADRPESKSTGIQGKGIRIGARMRQPEVIQ